MSARPLVSVGMSQTGHGVPAMSSSHAYDAVLNERRVRLLENRLTERDSGHMLCAPCRQGTGTKCSGNVSRKRGHLPMTRKARNSQPLNGQRPRMDPVFCKLKGQ